MPIRFSQVDEKLYRGGAPKKWEVSTLKNYFGVERIISLDEEDAYKIKNECKELGIDHVIIPIEAIDDSIINLDKIEKGVTDIVGDKISYVHCHHGKDRTGLFVAKYRIENGWPCKRALDEALSFGFASGLSEQVTKAYTDILSKACDNKHKHITIDDVYNLDNIFCDECGMTKDENGNCQGCYKTAALIKMTLDSTSDKEMTKNNINTTSELLDTANNFSRKAKLKMLNRLANSNKQIMFEVPEAEKKAAVLALEHLDDLLENKLSNMMEHLELIYEPFKNHQGITPEQAHSAEVHFQTFVETVKENLTDVKISIYKCMKLLETFSSDHEVGKILKSIDEFIDNLDHQVETLTDVLENTKSKEFQTNVIKCIDAIKKIEAQIEELINERIKDFLKKNILNENWATEIKREISEEKEEQADNEGI